MTTTITALDDFNALDPFFRIIEKGLDGIADGGHFFDLLAEKVIFDYIITTPGYPRHIEGRKAVAELYRPYGTMIVLDRCHDLAVHHDHGHLRAHRAERRHVARPARSRRGGQADRPDQRHVRLRRLRQGHQRLLRLAPARQARHHVLNPESSSTSVAETDRIVRRTGIAGIGVPEHQRRNSLGVRRGEHDRHRLCGTTSTTRSAPARHEFRHNSAGKCSGRCECTGPDLHLRWWRGEDLNLRPSGYEGVATRPARCGVVRVRMAQSR